ncbi:MAG: hypothetical protein ACPLYF_05250 [Fervidobacterium sp.]
MRKVVFLVFVLVAFAFDIRQVSAIEPLSTGLEGFAGYVRDKAGNPIAGANVSYGWLWTLTDANGYYEIFIGHRVGSGDLWCRKEGFFTEVIRNNDPEGGWYDFYLSDDPATMVTIIAFFPNTPYSYVKYTWGYSHTITVKAYSGGYGSTVTFTREVTTSVDSPYPSRSFKRRTIATGVYNGSDNYKPIDVWIKDLCEPGFYDMFYENEYLNPSNVVGATYGLLPGSTIEQTVSLSGSTTLQAGLKTSVSVSIPIIGVGFSVDLETTLAVTVGCSDQVYWKITNTDSDYKHYFKVHYEGDTVPHIWDIGKEYVGGDPGGGCPILYVFDGEEYVEEGLLNIHNPNGTDVTAFHTLRTRPQTVHNTLMLRLVEHPQTHSYIDQVKLYAELENGQLIELKLVSATHSEYGNVLPQLLFSDDWKTDALGADLNNGISQSIDLKFLLPKDINAVGFVFQIEGNNIIAKV